MSYEETYRRRVIAFVQEGGSKREAARLFKVSRETIYQWLRRGEDLSLRLPGTRQRKIDKESLRRHVREYPDALLREPTPKAEKNSGNRIYQAYFNAPNFCWKYHIHPKNYCCRIKSHLD